MGKINRLTGMASGEASVYGNVITSKYKGRQIFRRLAKEYLRMNTTAWLKSKIVFSFRGAIWKTLPKDIQDGWGVWAAQQGSASEVERSELVTHRYCPIAHYPPRPKLMSGFNAMVGACARTTLYGFSGERYREPGVQVPSEPPLGVNVVGYDPKKGEITVEFPVGAVFQAKECDQAKFPIWVNLQSEGEYLAMQHLLTSLDRPLTATTIRHKFNAIQTQTKKLNYAKEIRLADLRYFYIDIGDQTAATYGADRTCTVSSGFWQHFLFLNDPRLIEVADLIKMGHFKDIGKIKFHKKFYKTVRRLRKQFPQPDIRELLQMCFVVLTDKTIKKFQQKFIKIRPK